MLKDLQVYFQAKRPAILIQTYEETRLIEEMKPLLSSNQMDAFVWTISSGMKNVFDEQIERLPDPIAAIEKAKTFEQKSAFLFPDFHDLWSNPTVKRKLRDVLEQPMQLYKPLIFITPINQTIPAELEKLITVMTFDVPNRETIVTLVEEMEHFLREKDCPLPDPKEREAVIHALAGMTHQEIQNILRKSAIKHRAIKVSEIVAEKEMIIKKTGLLEYITKIGDINEVGGMDQLKAWFSDAYYAFDPQSKELGIDNVKGIVLSGVPGCGKSLVAKSISSYFNIPLLKMNMSDIMGSKVGESEKNISRALKLAEDVSPCVLWLDEMEKALAGMSSSDQSDAGTLSRVVQEILTWLSDKTSPVFVVATANDITKLPPELTRAGRFDEIFFVSLPHLRERQEIFQIHLEKRKYTYVDNQIGPELQRNTFGQAVLYGLASETEGFSGAEIEQVIREATRTAYARFKKGNASSYYVTRFDLLEQIKKTVPLSKKNTKLIADLRNWAKQTAVCVSSEEHQLIHQQKKALQNKNNVTKFSDLLDL